MTVLALTFGCTSLAGLALAAYCWRGWSKSEKRELALVIENRNLRVACSKRRHLHVVPDDRGAA